MAIPPAASARWRAEVCSIPEPRRSWHAQINDCHDAPHGASTESGLP